MSFDSTPTAGPSPVEPTAPRVRWAAIIWGVIFATTASLGIWIVSDSVRRDGLSEWATSLTPGVIGSIALLAVGGLVLVLGAIGLIRRAQRRSAS